MSITIDNFKEYKICKNEVLHKSFNDKFTYILRKFESLSKTNNYKKIQKANIIQITKEDDNILNLLNKISDQNYDVISQKILLKLTRNNSIKFIDQIFLYIEKANSNTICIWSLIQIIFVNKLTDINQKQIIITKLKMFIDTFIETFDITKITSTNNINNEEYIEFVERNHSNTVILSKMNMIYTIISDDNVLNLNYDMDVLFTVMINQLNVLITESTHENIIYVLLDCVFMIIKSRDLLSNPNNTYIEFINMFDNESIRKNLKNKIRFKLLDIFDYIRNGL